MRVRPYRPADEPSVIEIWRACELTRPWNDPKRDIARKLAAQPELFLVGEVDDKVVATAMFGYDGHRGSVAYLGVLPEFQRQALGKQLMQAGEALLLAQGCPKINLLVRTSNSGVIEFYRSLGYVMDEVVELGKRLIPD
ncbi:MAG TPA: GNAT family acetyltransferase [Polyangiaceae bacterium]